ncbi:MAG: hypothetical protein QM714_10970 [Nocardioides sp.]|uniref:hypothetical protein n=1 Tax=Nocardioides sp. TaxID=35761 RepID=UPI0039E662B3
MPGDASPTVQGSPLPTCFGIDEQPEVDDLVLGGQSVALVSFVIEEASDNADESPLYFPPVRDVQLIAGELTKGDVSRLRMPALGKQGLLPGSYAALIGDDGAQGSYFTSLGYSGLFSFSGDELTQICGPGDDRFGLSPAPGEPVSVTQFSDWAIPDFTKVQELLAQVPTSDPAESETQSTD